MCRDVVKPVELMWDLLGAASLPPGAGTCGAPVSTYSHAYITPHRMVSSPTIFESSEIMGVMMRLHPDSPFSSGEIRHTSIRIDILIHLVYSSEVDIPIKEPTANHRISRQVAEQSRVFSV